MTDKQTQFSWVTFLATFTMGAIDAYTYLAHDETFASAQTGNIIVFAVKFAQGGITKAWTNIPIWIGFALGCLIAQATLSWLNQQMTVKRRYQCLMGVTLVTLIVASVGQHWFNEMILIFILGWLSGYELTSFREVKGTTVNNGIMTGNTKNMMTALYDGWIQRDSASRTKCAWIALTLLTFILGAIGSALICLRVSPNWILWLCSLLNAVGLLIIWFSNAFEIPSNGV